MATKKGKHNCNTNIKYGPDVTAPQILLAKPRETQKTKNLDKTKKPKNQNFSENVWSEAHVWFFLAALPSGWTMDSDGFFQLQDSPVDFWEIKAGCLIRHHLRPRRQLFQINQNMDVPIEPSLLDPVRITVIKTPSGLIETVNDSGMESRTYATPWVGCSIFQISGRARRVACTPISRRRRWPRK